MLTKKQIIGIATLIGGTLGAGLFGVPYVFAHAGVMRGTIWTLLIGAITIILNLLQSEVSLSMPDKMPLAGMIKKLLPGRRGFAGVFVTCMQFFIALFVYTSLIGGFLNLLLGAEHAIHPAATAAIYSLCIGALLIHGISSIKKYDKIIVATFICTLLFIIIYGFSLTSPGHFSLVDNSQWFLPYGILIYSLNGVSTIPLIEDMMGKEKKRLPAIIIIAGLICISILLLWGWSIVGISGAATSPDALSGLQIFLPTWVMRLSGLVGILALISPHLIIGEHLKETLEKSFRFHSIDARTTVVLFPLIAYLYIESDFVGTLGFSGAIFTGLICVIVGVMNLILHKKQSKRETHILPYNKFFSYLIIIIFGAGIIYEFCKEFFM